MSLCAIWVIVSFAYNAIKYDGAPRSLVFTYGELLSVLRLVVRILKVLLLARCLALQVVLLSVGNLGLEDKI